MRTVNEDGASYNCMTTIQAEVHVVYIMTRILYLFAPFNKLKLSLSITSYIRIGTGKNASNVC